MGNKASVLKWRKNHPEKNQAIRRLWKQANPEKVKLYMAKANAKRAGHEFVLTPTAYAYFTSQTCFYCNNKLGNVQNERSGISLDRIDNSKGYLPNNVLTCCCFCNRTRGDRLTVQETKEVIALICQLRRTKIYG